MRRFYVPPENFSDPAALFLSLDESKHLREVLRLRGGDKVHVFDGAGREFLCFVADTGAKKQAAQLEIIWEIKPAAPESALDLTLGVALLKSEKFDLVVQKAVELGVRSVVPLLTKRADAKTARVERWRKIALEAAKQSGRARLLEISEAIDFERFIENQNETKILFAERGGTKFSDVRFDAEKKKITAVTGCEGGWEDAEIEAAAARGFQIITLGGRILRAETAAVTVAAILQHRFGDLC